MGLPTKAHILPLIRMALAEDVGSGDATTLATISARAQSRAYMVAREPMVIAGLSVAAMVFQQVNSKLKVGYLAKDGQTVKAGTRLLEIQGSTRALLIAERTALNFIQRLCGVATCTAEYVKSVQGTKAKILDTRKTTPGLRLLQKYAVTCGGGQNHRIGLYDLVLIKDNHLAALTNEKPNAIAAAVTRSRQKYPRLRVEVEADTLVQVKQAVEAGADIILLDNMAPVQLREAVNLVGNRARTEASGGVNLKTVRAIARSGVDYISVGALTHSAPAADIALDFVD